MQMRKRCAGVSAAAIGLGCFWAFVAGPAARAQDKPMYKVDPYWPKPLPNKWIMQQVPTLAVDKDDHIWVLNRSRQIMPDETGASTTPPRTDCCIAGPGVMEFDTQGNFLKGWGGPGFGGPETLPGQTIEVDKKGNVWLSGMGRGDGLSKFSSDGKLLWEFGHRGPGPTPGQAATPLKDNNQQTDILYSGMAGFELDDDAHEIYIAEGETMNKRILVYDMDTGVFKRGWGGHGMPLSEISNDPVPPYDTTGPPPDIKELAILHCIHISHDGLVYVCERGSDRVQVFTKQGKFVTQFFVHPSTPARGPECGGPGSLKFGPCGTILNLAFSPAPEQKYVFIADAANDKVWIVNRKEGTTVGSFGDNGRMAGQFHFIDGIASDSHGNVYTGEVETGKRIQKFVPINGKQK